MQASNERGRHFPAKNFAAQCVGDDAQREKAQDMETLVGLMLLVILGLVLIRLVREILGR
jgi:neutral trehalase